MRLIKQPQIEYNLGGGSVVDEDMCHHVGPEEAGSRLLRQTGCSAVGSAHGLGP